MKIKEEAEEILSPLKENGVNQKIVLKKVKKEIKLDPEMLEKAIRLSIKSLMQKFKGKTVQEFNDFCEKEMMKENCSAAQVITVEQADTDIWHDLRIGRITASRLHEVSRCMSKNGSLVDKIMGKRGGFSFAMQRGTILEDYVFTELQKEYPNLKRCGLVLDAKYPFLGASPDGISDDFVLEIKCPANKNTHADYIDVTRLSRKYFAQIQLQMLMTKKNKALLGVAAIDFEETRNITQIWIPYDEEYVMDLIETSLEFYNQAIFPQIVRKYKKK